MNPTVCCTGSLADSTASSRRPRIGMSAFRPPLYGRWPSVSTFLPWAPALPFWFGLAVVPVVAGAALLVGHRLPSGFLPTEDQGFFYLNIQLPDAASLERTDAFTKEVESVLKHTNGVQYYSTIVGSSLLTQTNATYSAFVFVALKPWDKRETKETSIQSIMESVNAKLDRMPAGHAFAFSPPGISGVGTSGGFSFMLEDRVGKDVPYLAEN